MIVVQRAGVLDPPAVRHILVYSTLRRRATITALCLVCHGRPAYRPQQQYIAFNTDESAFM